MRARSLVGLGELPGRLRDGTRLLKGASALLCNADRAVKKTFIEATPGRNKKKRAAARSVGFFFRAGGELKFFFEKEKERGILNGE